MVLISKQIGNKNGLRQLVIRYILLNFNRYVQIIGKKMEKFSKKKVKYIF